MPLKEPLGELMQARQEVAALRAELAGTSASLQRSRDEAVALRARVSELEAALKAEAELRRQSADVHGKVVSGLRERVAELELKQGHVPALRSRLAELEEEAARTAELEALLAERNQRVAELSRRLSEAPASAGDDLKSIRGIGPKYEKALKALGITTFRQIAAWNDADIETVAERLKLKPERVRRDDWVGRAKKLAEAPNALERGAV